MEIKTCTACGKVLPADNFIGNSGKCDDCNIRRVNFITRMIVGLRSLFMR